MSHCFESTYSNTPAIVHYGQRRKRWGGSHGGNRQDSELSPASMRLTPSCRTWQLNLWACWGWERRGGTGSWLTPASFQETMLLSGHEGVGPRTTLGWCVSSCHSHLLHTPLFKRWCSTDKWTNDTCLSSPFQLPLCLPIPAQGCLPPF